MTLYFAIMFVLIIAANEADIKAARFSSGTYGVLAILSLAPLFLHLCLVYLVDLSKEKSQAKITMFSISTLK